MKKKLSLLVLVLMLAANLMAQKTYVLLAAVSNYNIPGMSEVNLHYTTTDIKDLRAVFKQQRNAVVSIVTGKNANVANIKQKLANIMSVARPDDTILFFFSGHGDRQGHFICYQGEPFAYATLYQLLAQAPTPRVAAFIDACFSGNVRQAATDASLQGRVKPLFLVSSRDSEASQEDPFLGNGLFFKSIIKAIRGKADANDDRQITIDELFKYTYNDVTRRQADQIHKQHPQMIGPSSLYNMVVTRWYPRAPLRRFRFVGFQRRFVRQTPPLHQR